MGLSGIQGLVCELQKQLSFYLASFVSSGILCSIPIVKSGNILDQTREIRQKKDGTLQGLDNSLQNCFSDCAIF